MHEKALDGGGFAETGVLKKPAFESEAPPETSTASNQEKGEEKAPAKNTQQTESHQVGAEEPRPVLGQVLPLEHSSLAGSPVSPPHRPQQLVKETPIHVELAFDNADLYEVLDATLYELFKVNYMVDPSLKAKVSFHISGDYTRSQFVNILNNTLQLDNLAIVQGPGDIFKVVRRPMSAGAGDAPLDRGGDAGGGDITRMIRLRYISSAAALKNVSPFMSRGAILTEDAMTNSLIMTDTSDNIDKAASILSALDIPYFKDISWRLFPIKEIDASDLAKDLDTVFKSGGLFNRPGMDKGAFQIIPLKTMNALLVVSKWPSIMTLIGKWVNVMDHADNTGTNVFVYFVQNGSAKELADILKQVYGGSATTSSNKVAIVKPVQKPTEAGGVGNVSGNVEIIPDETNNAIVVKATARDYTLIKNVLQRLDIVPRQVLIDVMVAEVSLTGSLQYGVEWYLQGRNSGYTMQGSLDDATKRPIMNSADSSVLQGFSFAVYNPVNFLRGLMYALGSDGGVNVLSSPNILAVDNKEASIEVGEDLPSVTGQVTSATSGTTITNTVQYIKTGILLKVTPHINSGGLVKMEISQEVSDKGPLNEQLQSYTITNRKVNTSLVAKDGQTIVMGGLIKSNKSSSEAGVPFLRKIPILGYLFSGGTKEAVKDELIFLITPHVITSRTQADAITKEFSERVRDLKRMIKERTNG